MKERFDKFKVWITKIGREIYYFISSGIFLRNFGGIVAMVALFFVLSFTWMKCYTKHGESLHIQDYVGMDLEDAIDRAESSSFQIVVNDSTYKPKLKPNIVLTQSPKPLSQVKKNRKIYVSITKKVPELVELPNLTGGNDDYKNFERKCKRKDVEVRILKEVFSNKLEPNTILEVYYNDVEITDELKGGYEVPKGGEIQCVVTKRGGGAVPIPELVCKKYDEAIFLIGSFNLNIGSVIKDKTVTNESSAYIWRQEPRFSASGTMRVGEQINIYLTQYKPKNCGGGANIESPAAIEAPANDSEEENEDFGGE